MGVEMRDLELARLGAKTRAPAGRSARGFRPLGGETVRPPRVALLVGIVVALAAAMAPQVANARWARVSSRPSTNAPYFVCPQRGHRPRCQVIEDPSRGSDRRGPVAAGAITAGPEQEVSPAFSGSGVEGGYSPADLRRAYDLPSTSQGVGQTVAVVDAHDDPHAEPDLNAYRSEYGIPECTESNGCFRKVNQTGGASYPSPDGVWAREIALDLDMVSAICPNCHILLVEASTGEGVDLAAAENEAAKLKATEISDSFAEAESSEYASAYDHPGIPIAAASGDHGYGVESPASHPGVIAVGGTTLVPAAGRRGWAESVWYDTGSGCSREPKPTWQKDSGCPYRTDNDVAAVADPNTPVSAYDSYETKSPWLLLGGTSVATPIVAAAMALASPYTRSFDGAEGLYLEAANEVGGFNDIVSGANGNCGNYLCEAGPGYDGPSGLGSLHGAPEVPPPAPVTEGASSITQTDATLGATVNPHGAEVDECRFEYGPTAAYGSIAACSSLPGAGTNPVPVSASIAGLAASTVYHFRIAVAYPGGAGNGGDLTFTTLGNPPTASTGAASAITQTSATLNATVNPNGAAVSECEFEYGANTSYGTTAPCTPSPGSGQAPVAVSAALTDLTANSTYHYRIAATNRQGTSHGNDQTVTLLPNPTTVISQAASAITQTSATLNATVNPNGAAVSECEFEYGANTSYGTTAPCTPSPGSGQAPVAVSAALTDLTANSTYHYRIAATNRQGTSHGNDQTVTLLPNLPTVSTGTASAVTQSSVTLNATVNPNGAAVSECEFEYGANTSYGTTAPCTPSPGSGQAPVAVSAALTDLTANSTYHYRIAATNRQGTSHGNDQTVTLLPNLPTVSTGTASAVTQSSVTLNATVNPNGAAISECEFEFNSSNDDVPCATLPGSQQGPEAVSASVYGLPAGATFLYRVLASNASGTSYGAIQEFATLPSSVLGPSLVALEPAAPPLAQFPPAQEAELTSTTLVVSSGGELNVRLRCPAADAGCRGTITLQTLGAVTAGSHSSGKRILTLAAGSFTVRHAGVASVKLRLSGRARKLLTRSRVLRARATLLTRGPAGAVYAWQATVTLRSGATKHS